MCFFCRHALECLSWVRGFSCSVLGGVKWRDTILFLIIPQKHSVVKAFLTLCKHFYLWAGAENGFLGERVKKVSGGGENVGAGA